MIEITTARLERMGACIQGVAAFGRCFPTGIRVPEWTPACQGIVLASECRAFFAWAVEKKLFPVWSLDRANLIGANLIGANLIGASLNRASLNRANLIGANLDRASLNGASLNGASLDGASLIGANLISANLIGASLNGANLIGANYCRHTIFPADFDPKSAGLILNESC